MPVENFQNLRLHRLYTNNNLVTPGFFKQFKIINRKQVNGVWMMVPRPA